MEMIKTKTAQKLGEYKETNIDTQKKYSDFLIESVNNGKKTILIKNDFLRLQLSFIKKGVIFYSDNVAEISKKVFEGISKDYSYTTNF